MIHEGSLQKSAQSSSQVQRNAWWLAVKPQVNPKRNENEPIIIYNGSKNLVPSCHFIGNLNWQ